MRIEFARGGTPSLLLRVQGLSPAFSRDQWAAQLSNFGRISSLQFNDATASALVQYCSLAEAVAAHNSLQGQTVGGCDLAVTFEASAPLSAPPP